MLRHLLLVAPVMLALGSTIQAQPVTNQSLPPILGEPSAPIVSVPIQGAPILSAPTLVSPPCTNCAQPSIAQVMDAAAPARERGLFESDHAFDSFIGPISNPVLSKDPRSLTEARFLYVSNWIPGENPLGSGDVQIYGMQVRLALTERLTLIADKDGYAAGRFGGLPNPNRDGWLNLALGLKYTFIRDVENQFLLTGGFQYEIPTGSSQVFQDHGAGLFTFFLTSGKRFGESTHVIFTSGYQQAVDETANSNFFYSQFHIDHCLFGWFYPLAEVNWFHYTSGGDRGLPPAIGEFDGLINLGTTGVTHNDLVTLALGAKIKPCKHLEVGCAWEFPLSNREDFLQDRLLVDVILRY